MTLSHLNRPARIIAFPIAVFFLYLAPSAAQILPDSDFQVWHETTVSVPVVKTKDSSGKETDKLSLLLLGTLRLGQNRLFPVDMRVGAGFDLKINRYLSFTPTYVYRRGEPFRNITELEHRVRFDVTVGHKWKRFSIRDRNRIEYRFRHSRRNSVRYRNKPTFSFPITHKEKEIFSPFVANEIYYDFTAKEFTTNEFTVGITRKLSKNASADIFYVRRDFLTGPFSHLNGVGVNLKFRID